MSLSACLLFFTILPPLPPLDYYNTSSGITSFRTIIVHLLFSGLLSIVSTIQLNYKSLEVLEPWKLSEGDHVPQLSAPKPDMWEVFDTCVWKQGKEEGRKEERKVVRGDKAEEVANFINLDSFPLFLSLHHLAQGSRRSQQHGIESVGW